MRHWCILISWIGWGNWVSNAQLVVRYYKLLWIPRQNFWLESTRQGKTYHWLKLPQAFWSSRSLREFSTKAASDFFLPVKRRGLLGQGPWFIALHPRHSRPWHTALFKPLSMKRWSSMVKREITPMFGWIPLKRQIFCLANLSSWMLFAVLLFLQRLYCGASTRSRLFLLICDGRSHSNGTFGTWNGSNGLFWPNDQTEWVESDLASNRLKLANNKLQMCNKQSF